MAPVLKCLGVSTNSASDHGMRQVFDPPLRFPEDTANIQTGSPALSAVPVCAPFYSCPVQQSERALLWETKYRTLTTTQVPVGARLFIQIVNPYRRFLFRPTPTPVAGLELLNFIPSL